MLKFSGFANLTSCLEAVPHSKSETQEKGEQSPSHNVAQQPNDTEVRSVSWLSKQSLVHRTPQERRKRARPEVQEITSSIPRKELQLLEQ